jgi:hypothetical protein
MPSDWGYWAVAIICAAIFVLSFAWSEHKEEKQ